MKKDRIYAADDEDTGPFEFNEAVAGVFPDMLRRSIPGYAATVDAIASLFRDLSALGLEWRRTLEPVLRKNSPTGRTGICASGVSHSRACRRRKPALAFWMRR